MRWSFIAFFMATFLLASAKAEYRVYRLQVFDLEGKPKRQVHSTLDHLQYPAYYPLNAGETIVYLDSWMCWNRSDHSDSLCADPTPPDESGEENAETSTDDKTRFPANSATSENQ